METLYKNKWLGIITALLLVANIITLVMLWNGNKGAAGLHMIPPPGRPFEFVVRELGLDDKQQQVYKQLRDEHQQLQRPVADSLAKARNDYFDLLKDTTVTDSKLLQYSSRTMELQQRMELINFKHFQKLRAICTSAQQQKFDAIIQEVLKHFAGRRPIPGREMGPHGEGDGPPPGHP